MKKINNEQCQWKKKTCYHVANVFLSRIELIWLITRLKISKMSKNAVLVKRFWKSWVIKMVVFFLFFSLKKVFYTLNKTAYTVFIHVQL